MSIEGGRARRPSPALRRLHRKRRLDYVFFLYSFELFYQGVDFGIPYMMPPMGGNFVKAHVLCKLEHWSIYEFGKLPSYNSHSLGVAHYFGYSYVPSADIQMVSPRTIICTVFALVHIFSM